MARLNIEESWWSDPRRFELADMLSQRLGIDSVDALYMADGVMVQTWRASQTYWKNKSPIPKLIHSTIRHLDLVVNALLGRFVGKSVYILGSAEHHAWINKATQNGKRGGRPKAMELLDNIANPLETTQKPPDNHLETPSKPSWLCALGSKREQNTYRPVANALLEYPPDFVRLWELFGKVGKKASAFKAYQRLQLAIPPEQLAADLPPAIAAYREHLRNESWKKSQHLSTWLNEDWRVWLEPQNANAAKHGEYKLLTAEEAINGTG